jgi:hypothetical protein
MREHQFCDGWLIPGLPFVRCHPKMTTMLKFRQTASKMKYQGKHWMEMQTITRIISDLRKALTVYWVVGVFIALASTQSGRAGFGDRITISGSEFRAGADRIWINGADTPWHNWNDFGGRFDADWWDKHFQQLHENGINATRVWISCSGDGGIKISATGHVSGCTHAFWRDLDSLFRIARDRQVYVMATLLSFDHFSNAHTNGQRWRNMITDTHNIDSLVENYVVPFVNRYKGNPWLWSIDLCNEPDWVHENKECGRLPWKPLQTCFARAAAAVHANSEILVTLGIAMSPKYVSDTRGTNVLSDRVLQALAGDDPRAHVDFYSPHYYGWQGRNNHDNPFHMSPAAYGLPGTRPALFGEFPSKGIPIDATAQDYEDAYQNGWQGAMGWTSNGVDNNGSLVTLGPATRDFRDRHNDLVFPEVKVPAAPSVLIPAPLPKAAAKP